MSSARVIKHVNTTVLVCENQDVPIDILGVKNLPL